MKELAFCEEWGEKLAARHPKDLSLEERTNLHEHISACSQCSAAYVAFNDMESRLRNLPQASPLLSCFPDLRDIEQDLSCSTLDIHVQCYDRFFEVLPDEIENAVLVVEDVVSYVLLDLFGGGSVDEVTIRFHSDLRMGLQDCSIHIRAQYFYQFFALLPRTQENMKHALVKSISTLLKELFGSVSIDSISLPLEREEEHQVDEKEQRTGVFWATDGGYSCA